MDFVNLLSDAVIRMAGPCDKTSDSKIYNVAMAGQAEIDMKFAEMALRPHPHEFALYYDS